MKIDFCLIPANALWWHQRKGNEQQRKINSARNGDRPIRLKSKILPRKFNSTILGDRPIQRGINQKI